MGYKHCLPSFLYTPNLPPFFFLGTLSVVLGAVSAFGVAATIAAGIVAWYYWRKRHRPGGYGLAQFQELELDGSLDE